MFDVCGGFNQEGVRGARATPRVGFNYRANSRTLQATLPTDAPTGFFQRNTLGALAAPPCQRTRQLASPILISSCGAQPLLKAVQRLLRASVSPNLSDEISVAIATTKTRQRPNGALRCQRTRHLSSTVRILSGGAKPLYCIKPSSTPRRNAYSVLPSHQTYSTRFRSQYATTKTGSRTFVIVFVKLAAEDR